MSNPANRLLNAGSFSLNLLSEAHASLTLLCALALPYFKRCEIVQSNLFVFSFTCSKSCMISTG